MEIKAAVKRLQIEFWIGTFCCLCFFIISELDMYETGLLAGNGTAEFVLETAGILLMLALVPTVLKLMPRMCHHFKNDIHSGLIAKYVRWSELRMGILLFVVLFNLVSYYFTMNNTGGICALVGVAASFFIYPSESRLRDELDLTEDELS